MIQKHCPAADLILYSQIEPVEIRQEQKMPSIIDEKLAYNRWFDYSQMLLRLITVILLAAVFSSAELQL